VFLVGGLAQVQVTEVKQKRPSTCRTVGSCCSTETRDQMYLRLFTYARYLNQRNIDPTYVDAFGNEKSVQRRQDVQLQKFFLPVFGLVPRSTVPLLPIRLVVEPVAGDPAQVVGAGNIS
jgi:hypothetical protein